MRKSDEYKGWTRVSRAVGEALVAKFPEIEHRFKLVDGILHVEWESANPNVPDPLQLICIDFPVVHWIHPDIYDFIWGPRIGLTREDMARNVANFLSGFFAEEYACSWTYEHGRVAKSGAQSVRLSSQVTALVWEHSGKEVTPDQVVRSWRGKWDQGEFPE